MISVTLLKKEIKSNWILLVIFLAVLSVYGSMITMMFDPKLGDSLNMMAESMPELFSAFGMADVGETLLEFVTNYLYGMLYVTFPCVFLIILSNRLIVKYVDNGSMAYLLSGPLKRRKLVFTQGFFLILCLIIMVVYITALILMVSEILFPGELDIQAFVRVNIGLLGLLIFFGGACFCASCFCNESKLSSTISTTVIVYSILLQMIAQVGEKFDNLKYATPLTLFDIPGLSSGNTQAWIMCLILYISGIILVTTGMIRFSKRDLPL